MSGHSLSAGTALLHPPQEHWYSGPQHRLSYDELGLGISERANRQLIGLLKLAQVEAKKRSEKQKRNKHDKNLCTRLC